MFVMRIAVRFLVVLAALWVGPGGVALAQSSTPGETRVSLDEELARSRESLERRRVTVERRAGKELRQMRRGEIVPDVIEVPELDPKNGGLGLVLLVGGALIVLDRRRQQLLADRG